VPLYDLSLHEQEVLTFLGESLVPLKGFPGVMWERPGRKKDRKAEGMF
jgi:hypothetical protein